MESVGPQLRDARLKLGLTLEQVSAKTRISSRILQGIEQDDLSGISSPFFYRSYVRQFAEQVGLEYSALAPLVQSTASTLPEPLMPGQVEFLPPKLSPLRASRPKNLRWLFPLSTLAFMLVGCSAVYAVWENARTNWHSAIAAFVSPGRPGSQEVKAPAEVTGHGGATYQARGGSSAVPSRPAPLVPKPTFHLEVSALESTWLSIMSDGSEVFRGVLDAAETRVLDGHNIARIRTGNAGATNFVFNGKAIGTLGARGEVRTIVFTKDNYEVLKVGPHIALTSFSPNGE